MPFRPLDLQIGARDPFLLQEREDLFAHLVRHGILDGDGTLVETRLPPAPEDLPAATPFAEHRDVLFDRIALRCAAAARRERVFRKKAGRAFGYSHCCTFERIG